MLLGVDLAWNQDPDLQTEFTVYKQHSMDDNKRVTDERMDERSIQRANNTRSAVSV